ncbi:hypothetical protein FKO01_07150 [Mesorhizobium sp. B2-3-3]|uniref:hypothetical protein n=1 Tax=Mesorhizobium sp. B2-4-15 TaxID=2589934 RepID=UPI0011522F95|nr:hypothetical protein [Mesorhizobium sp. B2-4-15]TPK72053.1 hypothetical protein FJ930_12780 [Mesorhizobium sp. B2-4-15]TPN37993.1 hypothetical protein FKO01_07150 [Mesorhizobium sp. B2-3-3]
MTNAKRLACVVAAFVTLAGAPAARAGDFDVDNSSTTVSNSPRPASGGPVRHPTAVAAVRG